MSPGSQIRALTANKAITKRATMSIGRSVVRIKPNFLDLLIASYSLIIKSFKDQSLQIIFRSLPLFNAPKANTAKERKIHPPRS